MNIWDELSSPIFCLAPMEGVTDLAFRGVIAHAARPDLFFTEFTNVSSFASEKGRQNALSRLKISSTDSPIIAQIWGKNPDHFSELASALKSLGFSGIDLNFGCPDRHVNRAGGGAAMIKTPELAVECIRRAKAHSNGLPVSVKTRLGFTYLDEYKDWLPTVLKEHPAALTVHLRTRKEMSKVPAHFELIPELLRLRAEFSPETKLLINGDLKSRADCLSLREKYPELDGFMIGRGIFENPYVFANPAHAPTKQELLDLLKLHLDLYDNSARGEIGSFRDRPEATAEEEAPKPRNDGSEGRRVSEGTIDQKRAFDTLKHYFKIYVRDFEGSKDLRIKLMDCKSVDEAKKVLTSGERSAQAGLPEATAEE